MLYKQTAFSTAVIVIIIGFIHYFYEQTSYSMRFCVDRSNPIKIQKFKNGEFTKLSGNFDQKDTEDVSVLQSLKFDGYKPVAQSWNLLDIDVREVDVITQRIKSASHMMDGGQSKGLGVESNQSSKLIVPNVVHYVFLGNDLKFTFTNYLSYCSVDRFIQPEEIFVYGDRPPSGYWWNLTIKEVKNIYHVKKQYSKLSPNGLMYKFPAHISDYMRTEILIRYGGIYLDADVLVLKSFNPLRHYPAVLGRETPRGVCNGIIIAKRGALFLRLLLEQYLSYEGQQETWADKSVKNTHLLARIYPHLVRVEETSLNRPNGAERTQIFDGRYNWTQNYALHLWIRMWPNQKRPNSVKDILEKNTTIGEIARLILFGSHEVKRIVSNKDFSKSTLGDAEVF